MLISAEATRPVTLLISTCLFLIYYISFNSGLDYVNNYIILSIGNKFEFPDIKLKHTDNSLKSLLNGVPELNCSYRVFNSRCLYTDWPRSLSFKIDLNKLCTSSNTTNPFEMASILLIKLSFNDIGSLKVIKSHLFKNSEESRG